jgi:hypothetical protein
MRPLSGQDAPIGLSFEPGTLQVVGLDAPLRRGPLGQQALEHAARHPDGAAVFADLDPELHRLPFGIPAGVVGKGEKHETGLSRTGPRRKQLVGIVDPHKRDAVLIGAVHGEPKIRLYRVAELALVDCSSAFGKAPTPESPVGIGRAPVDSELDVPGAARLFLPVDDRNHSQLLHTDAVGMWWGKSTGRSERI